MEKTDNPGKNGMPLWAAATGTAFIITLLYSLGRQFISAQGAASITYPIDILQGTPAPLYQADYPLDDAIFSSNFESGNLKSVVKASHNTYQLEIGEDCLNLTRFNNKNWFYFSIENKGPTRLITARIENMAYNWSMWKNGIAPVYRSEYTAWRWAFLDHFPLEMRLKKDSMQVTFKYRLRQNEKVFIALSYPWSYSTDRNFYSRLEAKYKHSKSLYFEKEVTQFDKVFSKSLQGRRIEMITITNKMSENNETHHFPQIGKKSPAFLGRNKSNTRFFPNKKYIILSARVHPSEVASSYVLKAFVERLLKDQHSYAKRFLDNFVVVIIPMLNPDGVANGYTRLDTNGINLNAHYKHADSKTPSIYVLKKFIKYLSVKKVLHAYIDLHAHTTKRGIFFFANPLSESNQRDILELPYLFYLYQKEFTFSRSRFGVVKGESTSRKEFYRITKCNRLYVLETNYWGETFTIKQLTARKLVKDNLRIVKNFGRFYNIPKFVEIGHNLARTIIESGDMEIMRNKPGVQPSLKLFYQDIDKVYKKLSSKSQRRKLQKTLKSQAKKYGRKTMFENSILALDSSTIGAGNDQLPVAIGTELQKAPSLAKNRPREVNYEVSDTLDEEDSLHKEEGYNGQDPPTPYSETSTP